MPVFSASVYTGIARGRLVTPPPSFSGGARGRGPYVRWARGAAKPPPFPSPSRRPGPPTPWRRVPLDPVRDAVFDREGSVLPRQTLGGESFEGRGGDSRSTLRPGVWWVPPSGAPVCRASVSATDVPLELHSSAGPGERPVRSAGVVPREEC